MGTYTSVLGFASDPAIAHRLHELSHAGKVEFLTISREDALRKRMRLKTDQGTECLIAITRDQTLGDGAVLELGDRAIVVKMMEERWLTLEPVDHATALELGYFCGNLHWRVRFVHNRIQIALEGPESDYLSRLERFLTKKKAIRIMPNG
jgi:urease accessory protein